LKELRLYLKKEIFENFDAKVSNDFTRTDEAIIDLN